jgi:hypothetical protein
MHRRDVGAVPSAPAFGRTTTRRCPTASRCRCASSCCCASRRIRTKERRRSLPAQPPSHRCTMYAHTHTHTHTHKHTHTHTREHHDLVGGDGRWRAVGRSANRRCDAAHAPKDSRDACVRPFPMRMCAEEGPPVGCLAGKAAFEARVDREGRRTCRPQEERKGSEGEPRLARAIWSPHRRAPSGTVQRLRLRDPLRFIQSRDVDVDCRTSRGARSSRARSKSTRRRTTRGRSAFLPLPFSAAPARARAPALPEPDEASAQHGPPHPSTAPACAQHACACKHA